MSSFDEKPIRTLYTKGLSDGTGYKLANNNNKNSYNSPTQFKNSPNYNSKNSYKDNRYYNDQNYDEDEDPDEEEELSPEFEDGPLNISPIKSPTQHRVAPAPPAPVQNSRTSFDATSNYRRPVNVNSASITNEPDKNPILTKSSPANISSKNSSTNDNNSNKSILKSSNTGPLPPLSSPANNPSVNPPPNNFNSTSRPSTIKINNGQNTNTIINTTTSGQAVTYQNNINNNNNNNNQNVEEDPRIAYNSNSFRYHNYYNSNMMARQYPEDYGNPMNNQPLHVADDSVLNDYNAIRIKRHDHDPQLHPIGSIRNQQNYNHQHIAHVDTNITTNYDFSENTDRSNRMNPVAFPINRRFRPPPPPMVPPELLSPEPPRALMPRTPPPFIPPPPGSGYLPPPLIPPPPPPVARKSVGFVKSASNPDVRNPLSLVETSYFYDDFDRPIMAHRREVYESDKFEDVDEGDEPKKLLVRRTPKKQHIIHHHVPARIRPRPMAIAASHPPPPPPPPPPRPGIKMYPPPIPPPITLLPPLIAPTPLIATGSTPAATHAAPPVQVYSSTVVNTPGPRVQMVKSAANPTAKYVVKKPSQSLYNYNSPDRRNVEAIMSDLSDILGDGSDNLTIVEYPQQTVTQGQTQTFMYPTPIRIPVADPNNVPKHFTVDDIPFKANFPMFPSKPQLPAPPPPGLGPQFHSPSLKYLSPSIFAPSQNVPQQTVPPVMIEVPFNQNGAALFN